ncbi:MAG: FecR domain-containing protein [Bacteroidales bacterium]|nr:FecR domain-containing protein [Bacteroidales bacterium]
MNNKGKYSDSDWEELASLLSGEKNEHSELLGRFIDEDKTDTAKKWKELRSMSDEKEINVDNAWKNVYDRINEDADKRVISHVRSGFLHSSFMKVAAIALIILSLGTAGAYLLNPDIFSKRITIATSNDQKNVQVSLPDGSTIYLNRNSEFSYRSNFGNHARNVMLTGETFFEIAPDASKPFIIDAGKAKVRVVGTSFNVISKNRESAVEVFVKTGKVTISNNTGAESLSLDPGYVGTMDSGTSRKTMNNNPNYISWKTGLLIYNGQKLDVVLSDLKRVYNMDIDVADPAILENEWTSPIDNQPQETIIRLICASFNLSYTKDGDVYHLTRK